MQFNQRPEKPSFRDTLRQLHPPFTRRPVVSRARVVRYSIIGGIVGFLLLGAFGQVTLSSIKLIALFSLPAVPLGALNGLFDAYYMGGYNRKGALWLLSFYLAFAAGNWLIFKATGNWAMPGTEDLKWWP